MTGTIWRNEDVITLVNLVRAGKSAGQIAAALSSAGNRDFSNNSVWNKIKRLRAQGLELPSLQSKADRVRTSTKPKRNKQMKGERKRPKTCTIAGFQKISMTALRANCTYQPAPVIAGFPTIQIRKDREGNPLAPVTLRRIDFGGARA